MEWLAPADTPTKSVLVGVLLICPAQSSPKLTRPPSDRSATECPYPAAAAVKVPTRGRPLTERDQVTVTGAVVHIDMHLVSAHLGSCGHVQMDVMFRSRFALDVTVPTRKPRRPDGPRFEASTSVLRYRIGG